MLSTQKNNATASWLLDGLGLALLITLFYFIWLGNHALFVPDEGRYSEVAREMIARHDYITPYLNGIVFLDKPALYYWLQASAIHLFGLNEWALRFWPACIGVLGALATYFTGRLLFTRRTGLLAAALLATSPIYYAAAHYANLDLEVAVWITITLFGLLLGFQSTNPTHRSRYFWFAWIFASFAFLTKGLIGIVFPITITGLWILLTHQWRLLRQFHLFGGVLIFIAITLPWYCLAQKANPEFLHFFFVTQQVTRFLAKADFNNRVPTWFYLPIIFAGFLPWSIFILQTMYRSIVLAVKNFREKHTELFLLLWFFTILIFFSIPKSKTIGYIIPTFPPLALLTARYLDTCWENTVRSFNISWIIFLSICWIALPICTVVQWNHHLPIAPWLIIITILFAITSVVLLWLYGKNTTIAPALYLLIIAAVIFSLIFSKSAASINQNSIKPLVLELKQTLQPNDEIVTYYSFYQDLPLYSERRITVVADWDAPDIPYRDNWVRELWYGMPFVDTHDWLINESTFWQRWNSQKHLIVLMDKKRFNQFKNTAKDTIKHIGTFNDVIWVSNQ
ncbi:MAG: glycosyltransferase family 39 protein [Gammaproteobacteria bacterium]|nr:glycosyltransferase family 39 protein [Gammaproteobacteria bacterium]